MDEETINNIKKVFVANNFKKTNLHKKVQATLTQHRVMLQAFLNKITPHNSHKPNINKRLKVILLLQLLMSYGSSTS